MQNRGLNLCVCVFVFSIVLSGIMDMKKAHVSVLNAYICTYSTVVM